MPSKRPPSKIFPKISTLPRQRTEAAHYLDMYKLTVEKRRIQQELDSIAQRSQRLQDRLSEIEQQISQLDDGAQAARQQEDRHLAQVPAYRRSSSDPVPSSNVYFPEVRSHNVPGDFSTVVLDY